MKLDKYGNCPACGPEGCVEPINHAEAEYDAIVELIDHKIRMELIGQKGQLTMALDVVYNALKRKEHHYNAPRQA